MKNIKSISTFFSLGLMVGALALPTLTFADCSTVFSATQTTRVGSRGENVKQLQSAINIILSRNLVLDGVFGPKTKGVVADMQRSIGTSPDGVAGPKTYAAIRTRLAQQCGSDQGASDTKNYTHTLKNFSSQTEAEEFVKAGIASQKSTGYARTSNISGLPIAMSASVESSMSMDAGSGGGEDFSVTNTQEVGVDEADIIKTDGSYIYTLTGGSHIDITKATDGELANTATIKLKERGQDMYLSGNTLVVIGSKSEKYTQSSPSARLSQTSFIPQARYSTASFYDVSNPTRPKLEKEYGFEGSTINSRVIDGYVYLITRKNSYWRNECCQILPMIQEDGGRSVVSNTPVSYFDMPYQNYSFTQVNGININNPEKLEQSTYMLDGGYQLYASENALYLSYLDYGSNRFSNGNNLTVQRGEETVIQKISVNRGKSNFVATGRIPGRTLNQFSMGEHKNNLRIATTTSNRWDDGISKNNLYILNSQMNQIGKVEGLAPGERIFSARFMGDKAYLVTFEQVDPLFVINVANPYRPYVEGELKIPGFSNYLHPYDETTLLGIGKDAKEIDGRLRTTGVKVALFDVSNVRNPREIDSLIIGGINARSQANNNHKAVLFSKEKNLLAIPFTEFDYQNTDDQFTGAIVLDVDKQNGIKLRGKIEHEEVSSNRWQSQIDRTLYIKDTLYSLSRKYLQSHDLGSLNHIDTQVLSAQQSSYQGYDIVQ